MKASKCYFPGCPNAAEHRHHITYKPPVTENLETATQLLRSGLGVRSVAKTAGLCKETVCRLRRHILTSEILKCECGRNVGHNGWCSYRYNQSSKRQEWMRTFQRPHKLRLEANCFLGLLSGVGSQRIDSTQCRIKGCVFPAAPGSLCRNHTRFFDYPVSMTDSGLDWDDLHDSERGESVLSVIKPWNNGIYFEHGGKRTRDVLAENF